MKILVYTDGGSTADKALDFAAEWTKRLKADLSVRIRSPSGRRCQSAAATSCPSGGGVSMAWVSLRTVMTASSACRSRAHAAVKARALSVVGRPSV